MPHAIIEHSSNIEHAVETLHVLHVVHAIMEASGLFAPSAIKTRRHVTHDYLVGQHNQNGSFIHITVYMMEGRTSEQKNTLSGRLFTEIAQRLPEVTSVTVDIRDMDASCYRKK